MRAGLLDTLLEMAREQVTVVTFLLGMMDWFQMDNKARLHETAQYMYQVFNPSLEIDQAKWITTKVYLLTSLALYQVKFGFSPTR